MKTRLSHHSEYGKIKSILIKSATHSFINQLKLSTEWKPLNFLKEPNFEQAVSEYIEFENLLKQNIDDIHHLPSSEEVTIDSMYCRDASIVTDHGIILCNMGKESRSYEPLQIKKYCIEHNIPILGEITHPGTIEGGDTAWIDETTLAVGHTYRTNKEGIRQLKKILEPYEIEVLVADLPHYKGPADVFHLMSVFSPIDRDVAVVYSPLMSIAFRNELLDRAFYLIEVADTEFESMACNVLAIAPRKCIIMDGNPLIKVSLIKAGCEVISYNGKNISYFGGGGPTCLTRPLKREMADTGFV
jgi:N-dimethylarginine dimethylaminohydrolase